MKANGVEANIMIYNEILFALANHESLSDIVRFFELTQRACTPNARTYNILIGALSRRGYTDKALEYFGELQRAQLQPTVGTYNAVLSGLAAMDDLPKLLDVFATAKKEGYVNDRAYNSVITTLVRLGQEQQAMVLFSEMKGLGITPMHSTYTTLLGTECRNNHFEKATELMVEMKKLGMRREEREGRKEGEKI